MHNSELAKKYQVSPLTCWRVSHSVTHKHELWIWFTLSYAMMKAFLRLAAVRDTKQAGELRGDTVHFIASSSPLFFYDAKRQHLSTIKTDGDLSFTITQQQTYRRKQLMDQANDNSLTALLTKKDPEMFREIVNTSTERRAEKRIQRKAWILSHVLRKTLCEHVNGLCPAGWLNEQSITKHWFQSVRICPYNWATGRNNLKVNEIFARVIERRGVNEFSVAKFLHPLVPVFLLNTHQQSWIKWLVPSVPTLHLQQSATHHFRKIVLRCNWLPLCHNRDRIIGIGSTERCRILLTRVTESVLCSA